MVDPAVGFGGYASGLFPGEKSTTYWLLPPVMAWIIAALYVRAAARFDKMAADVLTQNDSAGK